MTPEMLRRQVTHGSVTRIVGTTVELRGLRLAIGDAVELVRNDGTVSTGAVVAADDDHARMLVFDDTAGIAPGMHVRPRSGPLATPVGNALLGRVIDGLGRPIDGNGPIDAPSSPIDSPRISPLDRQRITQPLATGVRAIDTLCTVGRGQRVGLFAGSGVGKSTLLAMMVRGTDADRTVIALVGERGREVREFVEDVLGPEGRSRAVVVVATSDEPALMRFHAAQLATRIAEQFADDGSDVLLCVDSITRLATAQREIGLAAGEPPTTRGYPPSAFAMLPRLLERAGPRAAGTITGFYTVLVDGDDHDEPIADATRAILDGHIVLDRARAHRGQFPAIDPLASVSRLADLVTTPERRTDAAHVRRALAAIERVRDLIDLGAYVSGADSFVDAALPHDSALVDFLTQDQRQLCPIDDSWRQLASIAAAITPQEVAA